MKKCFLLKSITILTLVFALLACEEESDNTNGKYSDGNFILNEGNLGKSNASLTFVDNSGELVQDVFALENQNRPLGDVLQSAAINGNYIYLVMNGSNKVIVAEKTTFKQVEEITGFDNPRYIGFANNKAYISQWGNGGEVKVVNTQTLKIEKTIDAGTGAEYILAFNGKIIVANSGGFDTDSTLTLIDPANDQVEKTIVVKDSPEDMEIDFEGNLWILCKGAEVYDASYKLVKESPSYIVKLSKIDFSIGSATKIGDYIHPGNLEISKSKDKLYIALIYWDSDYTNDGIYEFAVSNTQLGSSPIIKGNFYGFDLNASSGNFWVCDAGDFSNPGNVNIFLPSGDSILSYKTGIIPNGVLFQ